MLNISHSNNLYFEIFTRELRETFAYKHSETIE